MNRRALILLLLPALAAAQRNREPRTWRVEDSEKIERSFRLSGGDPHKLLVDNISGYVHVTGAAGSEVKVSVSKRLHADSSAAMAEAKRDVKLDISQQGNFVRLYVDGPFRSRDGNGVNYRGDDYYGYRVTFDYDIEVPVDTELVLKTVNEGTIEARNTTGDFSFSGVNGGIDVSGLSGSGTVRTVNGPVKAAFTRNPAKPCEFRSVNGSIDVYFQPSLNADLQFRTLNGGIYSDFDVTTRPVPGKAQNVDGKFLYRVDHRDMAARAGSGGPELKFDTVNGAIRLHSKGL
jgi:hypothetical protein